MSDENTSLAVPEFPLNGSPERIVSLVPSLTESLFALNLGNRVIGVTKYCVHPATHVATLTRIGGTKNPDVQQIVDLKPDVVLANREENRREDVEALHSAGVPVWVTYPRTVADVFNILWTIMEMFGETSMVPRVRLIEQTYDLVAGVSRAIEHPPRVFVPIWKQPMMTMNADTYMHDLLRVCGGENVFSGHEQRYPTVTMEEVEEKQPDVILLPGEPYAFTEADSQMFNALDVPAVANQRIRLVDGSLLTWHGIRLAYALDTLPGLLSMGDEHGGVRRETGQDG